MKSVGGVGIGGFIGTDDTSEGSVDGTGRRRGGGWDWGNGGLAWEREESVLGGFGMNRCGCDVEPEGGFVLTVGREGVLGRFSGFDNKRAIGAIESENVSAAFLVK